MTHPVLLHASPSSVFFITLAAFCFILFLITKYFSLRSECWSAFLGPSFHETITECQTPSIVNPEISQDLLDLSPENLLKLHVVVKTYIVLMTSSADICSRHWAAHDLSDEFSIHPLVKDISGMAEIFEEAKMEQTTDHTLLLQRFQFQKPSWVWPPSRDTF